MKKCATCWFWNRDEILKGSEEWESGWGQCNKAEAEKGEPKDSSTLAYALGDYHEDDHGEYHSGRLFTKVNFGCVMHQQKIASKKDKQ